jgi:hypothetical protein
MRDLLRVVRTFNPQLVAALRALGFELEAANQIAQVRGRRLTVYVEPADGINVMLTIELPNGAWIICNIPAEIIKLAGEAATLDDDDA